MIGRRRAGQTGGRPLQRTQLCPGHRAPASPTQPLNSHPPRDGGEAVPTPMLRPLQSPSQPPKSILLPVSEPWIESTSDALVWVFGVDVFLFPVTKSEARSVSLRLSAFLRVPGRRPRDGNPRGPRLSSLCGESDGLHPSLTLIPEADPSPVLNVPVSSRSLDGSQKDQEKLSCLPLALDGITRPARGASPAESPGSGRRCENECEGDG